MRSEEQQKRRNDEERARRRIQLAAQAKAEQNPNHLGWCWFCKDQVFKFSGWVLSSFATGSRLRCKDCQ